MNCKSFGIDQTSHECSKVSYLSSHLKATQETDRRSYSLLTLITCSWNVSPTIQASKLEQIFKLSLQIWTNEPLCFKELGNHHLRWNNIKSSTGNFTKHPGVSPPDFLNFPSRPNDLPRLGWSSFSRPGSFYSEWRTTCFHKKKLEYFPWYWLFSKNPFIGLLQFPY